MIDRGSQDPDAGKVMASGDDDSPLELAKLAEGIKAEAKARDGLVTWVFGGADLGYPRHTLSVSYAPRVSDVKARLSTVEDSPGLKQADKTIKSLRALKF